MKFFSLDILNWSVLKQQDAKVVYLNGLIVTISARLSDRVAPGQERIKSVLDLLFMKKRRQSYVHQLQRTDIMRYDTK